jgi:hypothetical protein
MKGGNCSMPIYSQAERQDTYLDEASVVLSQSKYLTENESIYHPEMVPIRENAETGNLIIRLEDIIDYSVNNGIDNASNAISEVCIASKADPEKIIYSIDETSVLEDAQYEETARAFAKVAKVCYVPVSENSAAYMLAEACMRTMAQALEVGETQFADALFEAYINDDFEYLENDNVLSNLSDSFNEHSVNLAISESENNVSHWSAEKISSLRSLSRQYLDEHSPVAARFYKGIDFLGDYLKDIR